MKRRSLLFGVLDVVERVGNRLPHPATLFALFALSVVVMSGVLASLNLSVVHPGTGREITVTSLLSADGLRRMVTSLVTNFTNFAPLGTVLVAMLGIGVAEGSGLLSASLRALVLWAPRRWVTMIVVLTGILSNTASEAGYVILVPLAAVIFQSVGRHPLAGLAAAFAGVSAGYSANLMLGSIDPLLAGITQEIAHIIDPGYTVNPAANYYFMFASTFLLTAMGTWVTERLVEPRLGPVPSGGAEQLERLTPLERKGLRAAFGSVVVLAGLLLAATVPSWGVLRDPETGSLLHSPFLTGIVAVIFVSFFVPGIVYGVVTRSVRSDSDAVHAMGKAMSSLGVYIVLVFVAAQFVAYFAWTNIGLITAIEGAAFLKALGLTGIPLILAFIAVSGFLNLFMGSASAKWAVMAPVFVPMFMLLGYTPELTQVAYRVGDSVTNVITPMMSYFALIVAVAQKYRQDAGIGTLIAMMLPYTLVFFLGWSAFLLGWIALELPLGPGAGLYLNAP